MQWTRIASADDNQRRRTERHLKETGFFPFVKLVPVSRQPGKSQQNIASELTEEEGEITLELAGLDSGIIRWQLQYRNIGSIISALWSPTSVPEAATLAAVHRIGLIRSDRETKSECAIATFPILFYFLFISSYYYSIRPASRRTKCNTVDLWLISTDQYQLAQPRLQSSIHSLSPFAVFRRRIHLQCHDREQLIKIVARSSVASILGHEPTSISLASVPRNWGVKLANGPSLKHIHWHFIGHFTSFLFISRRLSWNKLII